MRRHTRLHGTKVVLAQYEIMDSSQIEELPEVQIVKRHQVLPLLESYLATTPPAEQHLLLVHHHKELLKVEEGLNSYKTLPFAEWSSLAWNGFFRDLQLELKGCRRPFSSDDSHLNWHSQAHLFKFYKGKRLVYKFSYFLELTNEGLHCIFPNGLIAHMKVWRPYVWKHLERERLRVDTPASFECTDWQEAKIMGDFRRTNAKGMLDMEATVAYIRSWLVFMKGIRDSISADPLEGFTVITGEETSALY